MSESELNPGDGEVSEPFADLVPGTADGGAEPAGDSDFAAPGDEPADSAEPAGATDEPTRDPVAEFASELRLLPGDWYVVHSYAGYENRVRTNLESRTQSLNMEDYIFQIEVPVHEVTEIKGGKRQRPGEGAARLHPGPDGPDRPVVGRGAEHPGVTGFVGCPAARRR